MPGYDGARGTTAPRVTLSRTPLVSTSEGELEPCATPEVSLEPLVECRRVLKMHEVSTKVLAGHVVHRDGAGGVFHAVHEFEIQGFGQPREQRGAVADHPWVDHQLIFVDQSQIGQRQR